MLMREVMQILDAQCVVGEHLLDSDVQTACSSDMMSDVLAFVKDRALLLTGLVNQQVLRTAEMMDIHAIVFVRGKNPDPIMVEMAAEKDMILLTTSNTLYISSGKLYKFGLGVKHE